MTDKKTRILSSILCLVLGAGVGFGSYYIADKTANGKNADFVLTDTTPQSNGDNVLITEQESNGLKLTATKLAVSDYALNSVSATSDTWYQVCATVNPVTAVVKLDWWLEFKNPNSSWANGKKVSDYFSLTPPADGAISATARALQPFAEPILIKAKVRGNETVTATCQADYAKRFTRAELSLPVINFVICDEEKVGNDVVVPLYNFSSNSPYWRDPETIGLAQAYCFGTGTLASEIVSTKIEIKVSDEFMNVYRSAPYYNVNGNINECLYENWYTLGKNGLVYADLIDEMSQPFAQNNSWCNAEDYAEFLSAISTYNSTDFYVRITATVKYDEKLVDEVSEYSCRFNRGSEVFTVESLTFDNANLVF